MDELDQADLVRKIDASMIEKRLWLGVAESCTGGMLGHVITNLAGVSRTFLGGVISYDNWLKQKLLGVRESTLIQYGAVSSQTALEMAHGVRQAISSNTFPLHRIVGISVTGIAGPDGGSVSKPLGLVWIGFDSAWSSECLRYLGTGDRLENKQQFVDQALLFLLEQLETFPDPEPEPNDRGSCT